MCASKNIKPVQKKSYKKLITSCEVLEDPQPCIDYDPRLAMDADIEFENEEEFLEKAIEICNRDGINLNQKEYSTTNKSSLTRDIIPYSEIEMVDLENSSEEIKKLRAELSQYKKKLKQVKAHSEKKIDDLTKEKQLLIGNFLKEIAQDFFVNVMQCSQQQVINNIQINTPPSPLNAVNIKDLQPPRSNHCVQEEPIVRIKKIPPKIVQAYPAHEKQGDYSMVVSELETVLLNDGYLKPIDPEILEERAKRKEERKKNLRRAQPKICSQ